MIKHVHHCRLYPWMSQTNLNFNHTLHNYLPSFLLDTPNFSHAPCSQGSMFASSPRDYPGYKCSVLSVCSEPSVPTDYFANFAGILDTSIGTRKEQHLHFLSHCVSTNIASLSRNSSCHLSSVRCKANLCDEKCPFMCQEFCVVLV